MRRELSIADPVIPFGMGNRRTLLELTHDLRNYLTILQLRIDDFESEIPGIVSSNKGRVTEIMQKLELLLQELTDVTASRREQH